MARFVPTCACWLADLLRRQKLAQAKEALAALEDMETQQRETKLAEVR